MRMPEEARADPMCCIQARIKATETYISSREYQTASTTAAADT